MKFEEKHIYKDFVVVGAGMPGIVAAIQAARLGLSVALINDRGYLGGNASAEIRTPIGGADGEQEFNFYSREGGILEEIRLENLHRNPQGNPYIWDTVLNDFVYHEKNIELYLETNIDEIRTKSENQIEWVSGSQQDSEIQFYFHADYFLDDTGDGTVGYLAGADYRMGRESKKDFGERIAPDKPDDYVIPSTFTFFAKDAGEPVKYIPPDFALDLTKTDVLKHRSIPQNLFHRFQWYYELGGKMNQIKDIREIINKHLSLVYGIWDYIKNSGKYNSENYDLEYVSCIPGKRESRRLMGDYILTESDVVKQKEFNDVVGHGGWAIDLHAIEGFFDTAPENHWIYLKGIYQIPYRSGYSRNVENLFVAGRIMSTSHVAFGSTRVIATLCTLGQAIGAAVYLCKKHQLGPRQAYQERIRDLQQLLLKEDQYVVGIKNNDKDKVREATITASSVRKCELTNPDDSIDANRALGLIAPVRKHVDSISLLVKNKEKTALSYSVYQPDRKYNYSPDKKITAGELELPPSRDLRWVEIPVDVDINEDKLFLTIEENEKLCLGTTQKSLPGVISLRKCPNDNERILDVFTLKPKDYIWREIESVGKKKKSIGAGLLHSAKESFGLRSLCFRINPEQDVYGPDNVNLSYARPYGLPNLWVSEDREQKEWIEIDFDRPQSIRELILYFDSNFNFTLRNIGKKYNFNVIPTIVKDYRVYYKDQDKYRELARVEDNYQRVNKLRVKQVRTNKIKIEFLATNGHSGIHIYEVRAY